MTTTLPDLAVLAGLDLTPACELVKTPEHPADRAARCRRCGHVDFVCLKHVEELEEYAQARIAAGHGFWHCQACHQTTTTLDALAELVAL